MQPATTTFKRLTAVFVTMSLLSTLSHAVVRAAEYSPAWLPAVDALLGGMAGLAALLVAGLTWRSYRPYAFVTWPAGAALALALANVGLVLAAPAAAAPLLAAGRLVVLMLLVGTATYLAAAAHLPLDEPAQVGVRSPAHRDYFRSIVGSGLGFLLLLVTGSLVSETGAGAACPDWPLCWGQIFPLNFSLPVAIVLLHRFTVVAIGVLLAAVILQTRRGYANYRPLDRWSKALGWLFLVQVGLGGLYSIAGFPTALLSTVHLGLTGLTWASLVALGSTCYLTIETRVPAATTPPSPQPALSAKQRAVTYFKLTKPWVMILLLLTTITAMVIAAEGLPSLSLMLTTLLGGALSAGGASVLNSYIDSDIDQQMSRTSRRATVTGLVTPRETLIFGLTLSALSFLLFAIFVNMLSAVLSTTGILYYVFFYTLYLKRSTLHNIVIGGAAGAIPPLVGWTAITNSLDLGAFYLFAIIFFWTPPHTWALAMMVKKDYAQARVPMLPVVVGEKETSTQIFLYSVLLIALTLLPFTFGMVSGVYFVAALLLGARFLQLAWNLWQNYADKAISRKLYKFSQSYLAYLFLVMALDRALF